MIQFLYSAVAHHRPDDEPQRCKEIGELETLAHGHCRHKRIGIVSLFV
jgi:hypothetical protein